MTLKPWLEEQWQVLLSARNQQDLLAHLVKTVGRLDFDYCSFVLCAPYPTTAPKISLISNYPDRWQQRYQTCHYFGQDPVIEHCLHSILPLDWSNQHSSPFWEEASAHGINYGWAQSYRNAENVSGMLSFARSYEALDENELAEKELTFSWLTQLAYTTFYPFMISDLPTPNITLTTREKEVLRWTADGKTVEQIAEILAISERTVRFHIRNVSNKLGAANKTAATVQAVLLGLI